jgi:hypothetical protein
MRHFLSCIISFLLVFNSFAQYDSATFIIENAIHTRKNIDKIIYLDSSVGYFQSLGHFVRKGKLAGYNDTVKTTLSLSKREIKYIDSEFNTIKPVAWNQNMFENSVMITKDSLEIFYDGLKGPKYFQNHFAKKYFLFSKPVFIRNNSVAIFRLYEMYGPSSGYDLLYIYQRAADKWQQLMLIYMGAW